MNGLTIKMLCKKIIYVEIVSRPTTAPSDSGSAARAKARFARNAR